MGSCLPFPDVAHQRRECRRRNPGRLLRCGRDLEVRRWDPHLPGVQGEVGRPLGKCSPEVMPNFEEMRSTICGSQESIAETLTVCRSLDALFAVRCLFSIFALHTPF